MKVNPTGGDRPPVRARDNPPDGTYLAHIQWVQRSMSPRKGTPRLAFTLVIDAGPEKGKHAFDDAYLVPNSMWRLQRIVEATGITEAFDTDNENDLIEKFAGRTAVITTKIKSWPEKDRDGNPTGRMSEPRADVVSWRQTAETKARLAELEKQREAAAAAAEEARQKAEDAHEEEDKDSD